MDDTTATQRRAGTGSSDACTEPDWDGLVAQYQPLINAVCRRFGLGAHDSADVSQEVWLKAFTHLHTLRDPRALPGWLKTTTTHTACTVVGAARRTTLFADPAQLDNSTDSRALGVADEVEADLLREETVRAVRTGLSELPARSRQLVDLLVADPPVHYEQISELMDMPIGSIGPTRARCLSKLAGTASVRALLDTAA